MKKIFVCVFCLTAACMSPDGISPREPLRDARPVQELWIVEAMSETVSVVNLNRRAQGVEPHTVSPLFLAGRVPNSIAIHEGKGYIVNSGANSVTVFDLENPRIRHEIFLFPNANPWGIALVRHGEVTRALVTCLLDNSLAVLRIEENGGSLERRIALTNGRSPEGIASDGECAWIAMCGFNFTSHSYDAGVVTILDISAQDVSVWHEAAYVPVAINPQALALDSAKGEVYVLSSGVYDWQSGGLAENGGIAVIDAHTHAVKRSRALSEWAQDIVVRNTPGGGEVYIAGGNFIACYDALTLEELPRAAFAAGGDLSLVALALCVEERFLFAADFAHNRVLVYDLEEDSFDGAISCGDGPQALARSVLP